jgi:hypothetical protein
MASIVAPPEVFSAYSFAVEPGGGELDLDRGTHLRLYAGLGPSFPLAPFLVYGTDVREHAKTSVNVTDVNGQPVAGPPDLGRHGVLDATVLPDAGDRRRPVLVEVDGNVAAIRRAALLDQRGRTVAVRDKSPWAFSAPVLHKLRVWGDAGEIEVARRVFSADTVLELGESEPLSVLGLPIEGNHRWYVGSQTPADGARRVEFGAPLRLNPTDRPFGPFDAVTAQDEVSRVAALQDAMESNVGIGTLVGRLVSDEAAPWLQRDTTELPASRGGATQFATAHRLGSLQMAAADPGMARYLGFADRIDELPAPPGGRWNTLLVVGLFALSPRDFVRFGVDLTALLRGPAPNGDRLYEQYLDALRRATGRDQRGEIDDMVRRVRDGGFAVAPFVTAVAPVPPWLPPSLPDPQIFQVRWQQSRAGAPSDLFRASFAFPGMPLASLSALARRENGQWVTRHELLDAPPPARAAPAVFGHEVDADVRQDELRLKSKLQETAGLLSDHEIPGDSGVAEFAARASDFFGRFGPETVFGVQPPARPRPPKPVLRFLVDRDGALDPQSEGPRSPGVLKVNVAVPRPWPEAENRFSDADQKKLGSSIIVPRLDDLPAGALALSAVEFGIGAPGTSVGVTPPGVREFQIPLPALLPQETKTFLFVGRFVDSDGHESDLAEASFAVTDVRPPKTYKSGVGLFWTSAPGPTNEVELRLRWSAGAGSRHRVYLTDQAGLGLTDSDLGVEPAGAQPSRGLVAAVGCQKVIGGQAGDRNAFRLLTDPPLSAAPGGVVTFETRLPRSLATVQFLRVVPLGPEGAEPVFDKCGIVPVAVPESRRPPPPRLDGRVDPATGFATLTVSTDGFDLVALERDEPGLFHTGRPGTEAPRAVIRRAVGAVADPIYARPVGDKAMSYAGGESRFTAQIEDGNSGRGLEPFVRYVYWAEVRLPPERRLPADFTEVAGDVAPADPGAGQSHPRPRSLPSGPRVLMRVPPAPPAPLQAGSFEVVRQADGTGAVALTVNITDPPTAHAGAVGQYRLAVWVQWPGGPISPIRNAGGADLNGSWPIVSDGVVTTRVAVEGNSGPAAPLTLRLAVVDPVNRMGDVVVISVP